MRTLLILLSCGGTLAGLIHYFVDFKKLTISAELNPIKGDNPGFFSTLSAFLKANWEFFAYIIIGISGAYLLPVIYEILGRSLPGLEKIKTYLEAKPANNRSPSAQTDIPDLSFWLKSVLLGYGIIFGYICLQLIKRISDILLGRLEKLLEKQKKLEERWAGDKFYGNVRTYIEQISLNNPRTEFPDDEQAFEEWKRILGFSSCQENPNPAPWHVRRAAKSILALRDQIDLLAPKRNKDLDGIFGDAAHEKRNSDHNAWVWNDLEEKGIVTALDITHDQQKCDCTKLAASFQNSKDERIKYLIWNRQIMSSYPVGNVPAWTWREYKQPNPHTEHIHISVSCSLPQYDDVSSWGIAII